MSLALRIVADDGKEMSGPYLLRLPGWTEDQYFREAPESRFVEFEDGEVIVHSPVGIRHQRITIFLIMLLHGYVRRRGLGEILSGPAVVRLRPGLDYEPDIFFVPMSQLGNLAKEYFAGVPGLIVEVLSESTRTHDVKTKASAYRQQRVPEYWIIDPERRFILRHVLAADPLAPYGISEHTQGRLESQAIPGFWIDASWLWQDLLPDELHCLEQILSS